MEAATRFKAQKRKKSSWYVKHSHLKENKRKLIDRTYKNNS